MGKPSIICVDDELYILHCLKEQLLLNYGSAFHIEIAESSREALEIMAELLSQQEEVPLILSDYIMPDMKGDELLRKIHALNPDTVLVLLTGQATLQGVANAVNQAGVFRYLEKPWRIESLFATVSAALDHYYQEKIIERINGQLREINRQLKETLTQREADLLINQQMLDSTDRIQIIGRVVSDLGNEVNQLLSLISAALDAIREWQQTMGDTGSATLASYIQSVTDYYRTTSEAFNDLLSVFDRDTLQGLFYGHEKNRMDEIYAKVSATRREISVSVTGLLQHLQEVHP